MKTMGTSFMVLLVNTFGLSIAQWTSVGTGVHYRNYGYGSGVLIMYAGWSVNDILSQHWTDRMIQQRHAIPLLNNVGHVYAVRGPRDVDYHSAEISNSKLIRHLLSLSISHPDHVFVIAHSSGTHVAHEFFTQFHGSAGDTSGQFNNKLIYFNLDGAGGLNAVSRSKIKEYFVFAKAGALQSMNANTMKALGYSQNLIAIDGSHSGCLGSKCLHDFMINQHPWDPYGFNLEKDYGLFAIGTHELQFYYLTWLSSRLS